MNVSPLRAPFPPEQVNKLPKPTIKLDQWKLLPRLPCKTCGGYHPATATIHLDFVGHANVTERLLDVDPEWTWEPVSFEADGQPCLVRDSNGEPRGLWIRLTVCGVTRYGYGSSTPKADAVKELIGDAIRNAAMRFGVALDLWKKEDSGAGAETPVVSPPNQGARPLPSTPNPSASPPAGRVPAVAAATPAAVKPSDRARLKGRLIAMYPEERKGWLGRWKFDTLTPAELDALPDPKLREMIADLAGDQAVLV